MTDPLEQARWFSAVADVFAQIEGVYRVFGVKDAAGEATVFPMSTEFPAGSVVGVLGMGGAEVIAGSWERQTYTLPAAVWIPATAETLDKAYTLAVAYVDRVMAVFPGHGRAQNVEASIQSLVVTGFDQIESRYVGDPETEREYVVLPFSLELVRAVARRYEPA